MALTFGKWTRGGKPATIMRVEFTLDARDLAHGVLLAMQDEGVPADEVTAAMVESAIRDGLHEHGREVIDFTAEDGVDRDTDIDDAETRARQLWPAAFTEIGVRSH